MVDTSQLLSGWPPYLDGHFWSLEFSVLFINRKGWTRKDFLAQNKRRRRKEGRQAGREGGGEGRREREGEEKEMSEERKHEALNEGGKQRKL